MFGRMMVEPVVQVDPGVDLQTAVGALIRVAENVEIVRWIEQFGGYSVSQLEELLNDCKFLDLVERPGLWRTGLPWVVVPGKPPEVAV